MIKYRSGIFHVQIVFLPLIITTIKQFEQYNNNLMKYIGAHVSAAGGVENAPLNAKKIGAKAFEKNEGNIVFSLTDIDIKKDYEAWKNTIEEGIIEVVKEPATLYQQPHNADKLISMIKNYDLANSTPMQGLTFIQQLKLEIHKVEENNGNI